MSTRSSDSQPFNLATFAATHNSYSGGSRGSVPSQLDLGCRLVEYDLYNSSYARYDDFRLGHAWAGNGVSEGGGNPESDLLHDWLDVVLQWTAANPGHAPLTLVLDLKSDLSRASDGEGSLQDLQDEVLAAFGPALWPASAFDGRWPEVGSLRGRVLVVLSGNQSSRKAYQARWATAGGGTEAPLFYEFQKGDSGQLQGSPVWAASHSQLDWVQTACSNGKAARAWGFSEDDAAPPPVTWPATDDPSAGWYQQYLAEVGAVR